MNITGGPLPSGDHRKVEPVLSTQPANTDQLPKGTATSSGAKEGDKAIFPAVLGTMMGVIAPPEQLPVIAAQPIHTQVNILLHFGMNILRLQSISDALKKALDDCQIMIDAKKDDQEAA